MGNALDDGYDFDQQDMKVRNEGRIEWTIQSQGLLEQRKEGKNKQTKIQNVLRQLPIDLFGQNVSQV